MIFGYQAAHTLKKNIYLEICLILLSVIWLEKWFSDQVWSEREAQEKPRKNYYVSTANIQSCL